MARPCKHRHVVDVDSIVNGEVLDRLCVDCDTRLGLYWLPPSGDVISAPNVELECSRCFTVVPALATRNHVLVCRLCAHELDESE